MAKKCTKPVPVSSFRYFEQLWPSLMAQSIQAYPDYSPPYSRLVSFTGCCALQSVKRRHKKRLRRNQNYSVFKRFFLEILLPSIITQTRTGISKINRNRNKKIIPGPLSPTSKKCAPKFPVADTNKFSQMQLIKSGKINPKSPRANFNMLNFWNN